MADATAIERVPSDLPEELSNLATLDNAGLREELSRSIRMTAAHLLRLAWIVRLLEERGEDLADLRLGLITYLRRIAYGQVLPEVVVRFAESPLMVQTIAQLPAPDQARIAAGDPVTLMVRRPDGTFDRRLADPLRMRRDQAWQVFAKGRIRDEGEQILYLEDREKGTVRTSKRAANSAIQPDPARGGLIVGKRFVPSGLVVSALAEMGGDLSDDPPEIALGIKLTEAEHVALKNAATRAGISMNVLVRRSLLVSGLFAGE